MVAILIRIMQNTCSNLCNIHSSQLLQPARTFLVQMVSVWQTQADAMDSMTVEMEVMRMAVVSRAGENSIT